MQRTNSDPRGSGFCKSVERLRLRERTEESNRNRGRCIRTGNLESRPLLRGGNQLAGMRNMACVPGHHLRKKREKIKTAPPANSRAPDRPPVLFPLRLILSFVPESASAAAVQRRRRWQQRQKDKKLNLPHSSLSLLRSPSMLWCCTGRRHVAVVLSVVAAAAAVIVVVRTYGFCLLFSAFEKGFTRGGVVEDEWEPEKRATGRRNYKRTLNGTVQLNIIRNY